MPNQLTRKAVLAAVAEFDRLGRDPFLKKYGFRPARGYFLEFNGNRYDSKAIAGAAYGYLPGKPARGPQELIGGIWDAAAKLVELGFVVTTPSPDWTWDEHVLALELYMRNRVSPPGKNSPEVAELSALLLKLGEENDVFQTVKYRNPNGVYMKMMNFRRLDPVFQQQGKKGLSQGAAGETAVWIRFADDLEGLRDAATLIRLGIEHPELALPVSLITDEPDDEVDYEGAEGSLVVKLHLVRERNAKLVRDKRAQLIKTTGRLECECCRFDFSAAYGELGKGFVEIHHINPVALSHPGRVTKLSELVAVCSNCHRMLHRQGLISIAVLQGLMAGQGHAPSIR